MAAEVVAELLSGSCEPRDGMGAPEGMHDFDVELPDGGRVALEVTTIADHDVVGFHEALADADWAAPTWRVIGGSLCRTLTATSR